MDDVADVIDGAENNNQAAWVNENPAVIVNIQRQPGANIIKCGGPHRSASAAQRHLPASVGGCFHIDGPDHHDSCVGNQDVQFELMLTVALVVMVIFLFLRNLVATVIPSVAVPLSLVGTFGAMYRLGYSLDNLSLMALTISTGFVVDDAIVVIENISPLSGGWRRATRGGNDGIEGDRVHRGIAERFADCGVDPASVHGRHCGRLFREFAVTLSVTIVVSAVVSLTLTPMLCAKLLAPARRSRSREPFYRTSERG